MGTCKWSKEMTHPPLLPPSPRSILHLCEACWFVCRWLWKKLQCWKEKPCREEVLSHQAWSLCLDYEDYTQRYDKCLKTDSPGKKKVLSLCRLPWPWYSHCGWFQAIKKILTRRCMEMGTIVLSRLSMPPDTKPLGMSFPGRSCWGTGCQEDRHGIECAWRVNEPNWAKTFLLATCISLVIFLLLVLNLCHCLVVTSWVSEKFLKSKMTVKDQNCGCKFWLPFPEGDLQSTQKHGLND